MAAPGDVRYARASGDVDIAYTVFGEGSFDVVVAAGFVTHLDLQWEFPWFESIKTLAQACRVIVFDKRGTGLSDRSLGFGSLEERSDDIRAVMDAAGSDEAIIYGVSEGGPMALVFAATYPGRARAVVLYGSAARFSEAPDYPIGSPRPVWDEFIDLIDREWGSTGRAYSAFIQHAPDPAEAERFLSVFERSACTPKMATEIMTRNRDIDVRDLLSTVAVPTLVMHCVHDPLVPVELGRYLGENIPGARYDELDGDFHGSWRKEDMAKLGPPLISFLGSLGLEEPRPAPTRALASVLFTDIVGSTDRAAAIGDHAWRDLLDKHDAVASQGVHEWAGRLVNTTGDGILATFDGPSAAIEAARAIRQRAVGIGVDIRAGVHTGEVELRGADVGGIGVHIGARIAALAGPGEILVSRTVKDLVIGSDIALEDRGSHVLKGVPDEWHVFAVHG